jgi:hypothetical protein
MDGRSLRDFSPSLSGCEQSILGIVFAGTDSRVPQPALKSFFCAVPRSYVGLQFFPHCAGWAAKWREMNIVLN